MSSEPPAEPATEPPPAEASGRRRTRSWVIGGAVLLVCLAIVAIGVSIQLSDGESGGADGDDQHTVSAAIDGREQAALHLVSGAAVVTVRTEAMGGTLYEVSTPPDAGVVPRTVDRDDRIEVHLTETGEAGPSSVEIVLSTEVDWSLLRFSGGATEQVVDLTGGTVGELDFAAGATRIEVTLPVPQGTVPVRVGAGAGELALRPPPEVPVQVTLHSGAGRVEIDGESHSGVAAETAFTPDGWEDATNRYDVEAAGVGELTVTRW